MCMRFVGTVYGFVFVRVIFLSYTYIISDECVSIITTIYNSSVIMLYNLDSFNASI